MRLSVSIFTVVFIVLIIFLSSCALPKRHFYIDVRETQNARIHHYENRRVLVSEKEKYNVIVFPRMDYIDSYKLKYMPISIVFLNKTGSNLYVSINNIVFLNGHNELSILRKGEVTSYLLSIGRPDYRGLTPEQIMVLSRQRMLLDKEQFKHERQLLDIIDENYLRYENISPNDSLQALIFVDLPTHGEQLQVIVELPEERHHFDFLITAR